MCGNLRLDVLAHLNGALVQERLAVVEEVDSAERRPGLVDRLREQVPVEHAGLPRPGDAGLGRAARLEARDVTGGGALDVQAVRERPDVHLALRDGLVRRERQLQRAVAAERRAAGVQILRAAGGPSARSRSSATWTSARRPARAWRRIGAAADDAAVAEHARRSSAARNRCNGWRGSSDMRHQDWNQAEPRAIRT